jgi:hypothetical protein
MHQEVRDWFGELRQQYPEAFACDSVLECGSYNVNGSVRDLFAAREYIGLDWRPGPGVDVVSLVHEYPGHATEPGCEYQPGRKFDTVVSTEMLEHDPHWRESVQRMIDLVKPGGTLIITCAAPGRGEHELACSPLAEYYREIGGAELCDLVRKWFDRVRWWQRRPGNPGGCSVDTYLVGVGRW